MNPVPDVVYVAPESDDMLPLKMTRLVVLGESNPIVRRKQDRALA